jgi:hypothetical protein
MLRAASHVLDANIDQANRPQYGIALAPMLLLPHVPDQFWLAESLLSVEVNGCYLVDEPRPHNESYLNSPVFSFLLSRTTPRSSVRAIAGRR